MNEKRNSENKGLSLGALETELRQIPEPAVPTGLEGRLLADIPVGKRASRVWYQTRLVRIAAAAAIVIGVVGILAWLTGGNGGANAAWASVAQRMQQVTHVHFYEITHRTNRRTTVTMEGWYSQGKVVTIKSNGTKFVDDGTTRTVFDQEGYLKQQGPSELANIKGQTFFETITQGWFKFDRQEYLTNRPNNVGEDFLIYRFEAPKEMADWIEEVSVTVGRNSLLPVQLKVYRKDEKDSYDLYILDYEAAEKPADFFGAEAQERPAQGQADIKLGGDEVVIDIAGSPGVQALAIRLYEKEFEDIGKLQVLDAAVITTEGFKRSFLRSIPWKANEIVKIGVGDDDWPDKKNRHINVRALIKPTNEKDVYQMEVDCWLGNAYRGPRD